MLAPAVGIRLDPARSMAREFVADDAYTDCHLAMAMQPVESREVRKLLAFYSLCSKDITSPAWPVEEMIANRLRWTGLMPRRLTRYSYR